MHILSPNYRKLFIALCHLSQMSHLCVQDLNVFSSKYSICEKVNFTPLLILDSMLVMPI